MTVALYFYDTAYKTDINMTAILLAIFGLGVSRKNGFTIITPL